MTTILPPSIQNPQSLPNTPGLEIPGAFPQEHTTTTRQRPLSDSNRPQPTSLPSTEKEGTRPGEHYGGVGPLPGSLSETSVAKLPEERASEAKVASAPPSRSKEIFPGTDRGDVVAPADLFAAKVPDERAGEVEADSASASKSRDPFADTDRGDIAPTILPVDSNASDERVGEGKADSESASKSKEPFAAIAPTVDPVGFKVPDERAVEGKVDSEFASKSKEPELAADTRLGGDAEGGAAASGISSVAPGETGQTRLDQKTVPQVSPDEVVDKQIPTAQRTESSGSTDVASPADSKFKEELREEEKSRRVYDEGPRPEQQQQQTPPPPPPHATAAGDLAMPKGVEEAPNKAAPVQQQEQQEQSDITGGSAQRKGRSSSDSDASNHGKASMINRVRGEMKVLLGKASGNKDKVEAGERMKQGTQ